MDSGFDLGALHDKKTMIEIAKRLPKRVYLIAEPWALGGSQWGKQDMSKEFAHTRWAIWNDDFREPARNFIQGYGDYLNRDRVMRAIVGSHIKDGGWALRPQQSINYIRVTMEGPWPIWLAVTNIESFWAYFSY